MVSVKIFKSMPNEIKKSNYFMTNTIDSNEET